MAAPEPGPPAAPPIVGLRREREVLTVALEAGRHVVIEGPPGTGKSTLLRDIARQAGQAVVFVEGNAELTPARLIGQYDPAQVLDEGYVPASFTDGPLLQAMRSGALLYLEEFNRVPEETLNVLITVLTEGEIAVPRLGVVRAGDGFRLIAAMNPFDAIGTARVSHAIADRICRVVLGYQDAAAEREITTAVTGETGEVVDFAVTLTRATREHRDVRMGASVRGAIDLVLLLTGLARLRGETRHGAGDGPGRRPRRPVRPDPDRRRVRPQPRVGARRTAGPALAGGLAALPLPAGDGAPGAARDGEAPDGRGKADGRAAAPAPATSLAARSGLGGAPRPGPGRRPADRQPGRAGRQAPVLRRRVARGRGGSTEDAFAQLLADDPDAAVTLLADLARATDRDLRAAARRLAARVFFRLGRAGQKPARGTRRLGAGRAEGDLDLDRTLDRLVGRLAARPPTSW